MNSLMNYGSDDDCEDSGEDRKRLASAPEKNHRGKTDEPNDVNYDDVKMDLSEDSNEGDEKPSKRERESRYREERRREKSSRYREDGRDRYRERYNRDEDKSRDKRSRDDKYRERRERKRSRSRERRRSRTPPRKERSKSKERTKRDHNKRYDRANNKMNRLDKMGIEIKTPDCQFVKPSDLQKSMSEEKHTDSKDRFFMPGITGRFRDQIERRKLLWQKKDPEPAEVAKPLPQIVPGSSRATKVWETTTFAQDSDGKVANKFKRLMGIRNPGDDGTGGATDVLKKQEEMFSSMEQQYEVARTATHTMRGVGLGFGSYSR